MHRALEWFQAHEALMWLLAGASLCAFLATLIAIPIIVVRLPEDYFDGPQRELWLRGGDHPAWRSAIRLLKSIIGVIFILGGLAMFVLPGQGILTMLVGLMLLNFPGKYRLERWLVARPPVIRAVNWLRRRAKCPPLRAPTPASP